MSSLIGLLRLMEDEHYTALLGSYEDKRNLKVSQLLLQSSVIYLSMYTVLYISICMKVECYKLQKRAFVKRFDEILHQQKLFL